MIISEILRSIMINTSSNLRQSLISTVKIHISEFHMMKYLYGVFYQESSFASRLFMTQPVLVQCINKQGMVLNYSSL